MVSLVIVLSLLCEEAEGSSDFASGSLILVLLLIFLVSTIAKVCSLSSVVVGSVASATSGGPIVVSLSHLNRNDTAKGSSSGWVLTSDKTNVIFTGNRSGTSLASRNRSHKRKVAHLTIAVATTVVAGNVGGHGDVIPRVTSAIRVDHTGVRTSAIRVDLVDSHLKATTRVDLWKLVASFLHDVEGALFDVVVTASKSLANSVSGIATEASSVSLERTASGTITRSRGVDTKSHARATSIANGVGDDAVGSCEIGSDEKGPDEVLDGRHCDNYEVCVGGSKRLGEGRKKM
jgi:hypothetical protein